MNTALLTQQSRGRNNGSRSVPTQKMGDAFVQELIQCGFRIENLARGRGRSLRQLERDFHRQCGYCPREVIHEIRMKLARERLHSDMRVNEIADGLGYSDPAHFSRAFCQFHGVTPSQMRRKLLKKSPRNASMSLFGKRMSQNGK